MPRYEYKCANCNASLVTFHSMKEEDVITDCVVCNSNNTMYKVFNSFFSNTSDKQQDKQKVGQITKEYIEKNKKLLDQQKKEAASKEYE